MNNKIILSAIAGIMLLCTHGYGVCCPSGTCIDISSEEELGKSAKTFFETQDQSVASKIKEISKKINESHSELEVDSKTILENTRKLKREYYILQQRILHNQALINELQSIVTDAISSNAEIKNNKNTIDTIYNLDKEVHDE